MIEVTALLVLFIVAYIVVSTLGFGLYLIISRVKGTSIWDMLEIKDNKAYQLTQKFLPLLNLVVWTVCSYVYFSIASDDHLFTIALIWLIGALVVDYVGFVLIKHPLSVDHKGFYIGQFPWIYFTYAAVFAAPFIASFFI